MNSFINYKVLDLENKTHIELLINNLLTNLLSTCSICGYENGKVYDAKNPTFYRIILKKEMPKFLFITFDLLKEDDIGNIEILQKIEYKRRLNYQNIISSIHTDTIKINNFNYNVKGIISKPQYNHFTSFIMNYTGNNNNLKLNKSYYYDGMSINHNIKEISNLKNYLGDALPYLDLYIKD